MALPNKNNLTTMDYSYLGQPFVLVPSKTAIGPNTLDYSYLGQPFFYAIQPELILVISDVVRVSDSIGKNAAIALADTIQTGDLLSRSIALNYISRAKVSDLLTESMSSSGQPSISIKKEHQGGGKQYRPSNTRDRLLREDDEVLTIIKIWTQCQ